MTLRSILAKYPTDKDTDHSYGPVYETLLAPLRDTATCILELGIDKGGSLLAWEEYFTRAHIYGIDIDDKSFLNSPRVTTIQADLNLYGPLITSITESPLRQQSCDLIIDDGPHNVIQQFGCLFILWPYLKPNGYYIIEDAVHMGMYLHGQIPPHWHNGPMLGIPLDKLLSVEVIDRIHIKNRSDDMLIVFKKGEIINDQSANYQVG